MSTLRHVWLGGVARVRSLSKCRAAALAVGGAKAASEGVAAGGAWMEPSELRFNAPAARVFSSLQLRPGEPLLLVPIAGPVAAVDQLPLSIEVRARTLAPGEPLRLVVTAPAAIDTLGGTFRGRPAGERADISLTSFSPHHIITALGTGGMVCVDDDAHWDLALTLRGWGRSSEPFMFGSKREQADLRLLEELDGIDYDALFIFRELAFGFIPSEAGAAFGNAQLDQLPEFTKQRQRLFDSHLEYVRSKPDVFIPPRVLDGVDTTWICFPVQLRPDRGWSRKALQMHLLDAGIQNRLVFSGNVTRQPMLKNVAFRGDPEGFPNADQIMQYGTMLPCHPTMTLEDCDYLYEVLDAFIAKQG